jgi:Ca2+-binding RTX toxin-like protein
MSGYVSGIENYSNNHRISGTSGDDVIEINESDSGDNVNIYVNGELVAKDVPKSELENILIEGGGGNDVIVNHTDAAMRANGGEGNDQIYGGEGDDVLDGGAGNDIINGGKGNDTAYGREGTDLMTGLDGDDTLWGGAGTDYIRGGNGNDTLGGVLGEENTLEGGEGDDRLVVGNNTSNNVDGGGGSDSMVGSMALQAMEEDQGNPKTRKGRNGTQHGPHASTTGAGGGEGTTGATGTDGVTGANTEGATGGETESATGSEETGSSEEGGSTEESSESEEGSGSDGAGIWEVIAKMGEKVDKQLKNVMDAIDKVDTSAENNVTAKQLAKVQVQTAKLGWFGQTWQTVGQTAAQTGEKAGSAGKPS